MTTATATATARQAGDTITITDPASFYYGRSAVITERVDYRDELFGYHVELEDHRNLSLFLRACWAA